MNYINVKIYAVGSNEILTLEIKQALNLLFENSIQISTCSEKYISVHLDGDLYICNKSQEKNLLNYVAKEKIMILNLMPVSQFFLKMASIPAGAQICVFNNKITYIETFINLCKEMGADQFQYIPIPYSQLPDNEIYKLLEKAEYIIGVDILINEILNNEKYKRYLNPGAIIIGAKRVASIQSSMAILARVNELIYYQTKAMIEEFLSQVQHACEADVLHRHFDGLNTISSYLLEEFSNRKNMSINDAITRNALNQIISTEK